MANRVRFGITVGRGSPLDVLSQARMAAQAGFDSIWMMDHLNGFPVERGALEPFTLLGAIARECPSLLLGCAATDPFRRHPAILAQTLGTLAGLTTSPLVLVIGAGEAMNLRPFGFRQDRPLQHVRDCIKIVRDLLASSADTTASYKGDLYALDSAFLQLGHDGSQIAIYMATNGATGMRMAAELADGWVSLLLTPTLLAESRNTLIEAASSFGRIESAFEVVHHIDIALASDVPTGVALVRESTAKLLLGFPRATLRLGHTVTDEFNWKHLVVNQTNQQRLAAAIATVPQSAVEAISIVGNEEDCVRRIDEYVDSGVRHFIFRSANRIDDLGAFISKSVRARY